eukprot:TRINITY_DN60567_c0_g1_i1.p1 TRINITY_DN60567_c0_g1~~TRINITY_DN60567_c0_g1_i1.p1  ORF type:complete len:106 (-),score=14.95 TRINITY_DN60567_c0_g1_i1:108-425(-)
MYSHKHFSITVTGVNVYVCLHLVEPADISIVGVYHRVLHGDGKGLVCSYEPLPHYPSPLAQGNIVSIRGGGRAVSYTHLRAHETPEHLVCRLLLEKKKKKNKTVK